MTSRLLAAATLAMACAAGAGVKLTEDAPMVAAPVPGEVAGTIAPAERVSQLSAVSRDTGRRYLPASFDRKTGGFVFRNLPGDASYDVCLALKDGRVIEGIDLQFVDARLLRLAELRRKELGIEAAPEGEFTARDVEELRKYVRELKDFMEVRRELYISGQGRRATMLVELMRTREFYADKGDIVWRVELWYFENHYGGWERVANQERVLERRRVKPEEWAKIDVEYRPELSAFIDRQGKSQPVRFQIPDQTDPTRGRPAGTEFELKTLPHVLGAAAPATQPASAPAGGE